MYRQPTVLQLSPKRQETDLYFFRSLSHSSRGGCLLTQPAVNVQLPARKAMHGSLLFDGVDESAAFVPPGG